MATYNDWLQHNTTALSSSTPTSAQRVRRFGLTLALALALAGGAVGGGQSGAC